MNLILFSILGVALQLNNGNYLCFTWAKLAHLVGSRQADKAIKSVYLALSKTVTGSLGHFPSQNAEGSWEDGNIEKSDFQYL